MSKTIKARNPNGAVIGNTYKNTTNNISGILLSVGHSGGMPFLIRDKNGTCYWFSEITEISEDENYFAELFKKVPTGVRFKIKMDNYEIIMVIESKSGIILVECVLRYITFVYPDIIITDGDISYMNDKYEKIIQRKKGNDIIFYERD